MTQWKLAVVFPQENYEFSPWSLFDFVRGAKEYSVKLLIMFLIRKMDNGMELINRKNSGRDDLVMSDIQNKKNLWQHFFSGYRSAFP